MRINKSIISLFTMATVLVSGLSIIADASTPSSWEVNNKNTQLAGSVSGLTTTNDNALDFYCNKYISSTNDTYAKCDIQSSMKKTSEEKVILDRYGDSGSISFRSNWYAYSNQGMCTYTVYIRNPVTGCAVGGTAS
ncbi:hypothetical protein [Ruminococcus sp.]|uniref:hypothetical protein n=1 Tax=Ruminococcus sp. TaxID=41978 RepID=UPI001AFD7410|nr:hypothetical protein [Ruminococcus sp.]MBO5559718.1 hypothetical protein [Ruminococcus sp.]